LHSTSLPRSSNANLRPIGVGICDRTRIMDEDQNNQHNHDGHINLDPHTSLHDLTPEQMQQIQRYSVLFRRSRLISSSSSSSSMWVLVGITFRASFVAKVIRTKCRAKNQVSVANTQSINTISSRGLHFLASCAFRLLSSHSPHPFLPPLRMACERGQIADHAP
jgi:hypothetical protein